MKNLKTKLALLGSATLLTGQAFAQAATVAYDDITDSVNFDAVTPVILSVAGIIVAFILVKNNMSAIMSFVNRKSPK